MPTYGPNAVIPAPEPAVNVASGRVLRLDPRPLRALMSDMAETLLDCRGLKCPLPALKARKALSRLSPGDVLRVECTDPLAAIDIPNLARETGDAVEGLERTGELTIFRLRKAGPAGA